MRSPGRFPVFFHHLLSSVQVNIGRMRITSRQEISIVLDLLHISAVKIRVTLNFDLTQFVFTSDLCKKGLSMHTTSITQ